MFYLYFLYSIIQQNDMQTIQFILKQPVNKQTSYLIKYFEGNHRTKMKKI